jgi:Domain of unknown function (DUF4893)
MRSLAVALLFALSACARHPLPLDSGAPAVASDWRTVITDGDRKRLRNWRSDFAAALKKARDAGHGEAIDREGQLLVPDAAIPGALPNGDYRCRVIKLGAQGPGLLNFIAYPAFTCRVSADGAVQYFAKLTGSQRPYGKIYPADAMRSTFLGVLVLGDEQRPMRYSADPDRDVAGWVERIGPARWRIVLPAPRYESLTDVIELVPVT